MTRRRLASSPDQLDLLSWEPPTLVERYEEASVRAFDLQHKISRAVSETLSSATLSRDEIATQMALLPSIGSVSRGMLDNYAAPAKGHTISFVRAVALMQVTHDTRLLQLAADEFGRVLVDARHEAALRALMIDEQRRRLEADKRASLEAWRRGCR